MSDNNENSELEKEMQKEEEEKKQRPERIKNDVNNVKNKVDTAKRIKNAIDTVKSKNQNKSNGNSSPEQGQKTTQTSAKEEGKKGEAPVQNKASETNTSSKMATEGSKKAGGTTASGTTKAGEAASEGATKVGETATNSMANAGEKATKGMAHAGKTAANGATTAGKAAGGAAKAGATAAGGASKAGAAAGATAALPVILIIVIVVLVIIFITGIVLYFINMPGQILGKIKKIASDFAVAVRASINGDQTNVSDEDEIKLAQYIESMGYSVEGHGFADVTYSEEENDTYGTKTSSGKTKEITAVTPDSKSKNYLKNYMAADQSTYFKSKDNLLGYFKSFADNFKSIKNGDNLVNNSSTSSDYSTGMLVVDNSATIIDTTKADSNKHVLTIKGDKYNYSFGLDGWTSKYGRPLELFLALHLSTMMPDLTNQIAVNTEFNTKVHISFQNTYLYAKNMNITTDTGKTIVKNDIFKSYLNYVKTLFEKVEPTLQKELNSYQEKVDNSNDDPNAYSTDKIMLNRYKDYVKANQDSIKFLTSILQDSNNPDEQTSIENKREQVILQIKSAEELVSITSIFQNAGYIGAGEVYSEPRNTPLSGNGSKYSPDVTDTQLNELVELYADIAKGKKFYLPLITRVSNHWFWDGNKENEKGTSVDSENNVYFTASDENHVGTYQKTEAVKKWVNYTPNEKSSLKNFNIDIDGLIIAGNSNGIFYQVNEPYLTNEPNPELLALFKKTYYKYDGTEETARKIKIAKALDAGKDKYYFHGNKITITDEERKEYENKTLAQKEKPSFGTKKDTLSAFEILKNMGTEDSETIYRMLKQFVTSKALSEELGEENTLNASDITEDLKQILLWPFDKDLAEAPNAPGTTSKDTNEYGLVITDVNNKDFLAPISCTIKKVEDTTVTLELGKLSNKAKQALNLKYQNDFYNINDSLVDGWTMVVKGISGAEEGKTYKRGEKIGTASEKVTIVLQRLNKTVVGGKNDTTEDNIEDYMDSSYTLSDEKGYLDRENSTADKDAPIIIEGLFTTENQSSNVAPENVNIDDVKKQVYRLLTTTEVTDKPLNDKAACAIMGVIEKETQFSPTAINVKDGGCGLIQWTYGRKTKLIDWLNNNGYTLDSIEGQIKYFFIELEKSYGSGNKYNVYNYLVNEDHTVEEYLLYYFGHDEAGTNYVPGTPQWNKPYSSISSYTVKDLYEARLKAALGYYNNLNKLKN